MIREKCMVYNEETQYFIGGMYYGKNICVDVRVCYGHSQRHSAVCCVYVKRPRPIYSKSGV